MADAKISALDNLTSADPTNDMIPIVDVSATPPASGNTKRISINNILSSSPTASGALTVTGLVTAGSATITGALGAAGLNVTGATIPANGVYLGSANNLSFSAASTLGMTLNSTGLGVGGSPTSKLAIFAGADGDVALFRGGSTRQVQLGTSATAGYLNTDNGSAGLEIRTQGVARAYFDNAGNCGIGVTPITSHILSCAGPVGITGTSGGTRTSYITNSSTASLYYTESGGSGYFTDFGNLIIQPRTSAARSVVIATGSTTPVERAVVKSTGQVRFVPLAADPSGAETGDVYYNSSSNKLKCYNGTTWNDLF
jgi:hypothetical protein